MSDSKPTADSRRVIPLELNPDIFNALAYKSGLSPVLAFQDIYSLTDPDLLAFLPQPVMAVVMLFPITETYETYRRQQDTQPRESADVRWFKQTIGNGCGLYALLHVLANLSPDLIINDLIINQVLLLQITPDLLVEEVARLVELFEQLVQLDENYGSQGQTEAPPAEASVEYHFISFVKGKDNHLYELDGRRSGPVDLGTLEEPHILGPQLVEKITFYMEQADEAQKNNFALMGVAPSL